MAHWGVVGGAVGACERDADGAFPDGAHAFGGMAAPTFAIGVAVEDRGFDAREVTFVEPGSGNSHDVVAIVEHECIAVRVAEKIEGFDGLRRAGVNGPDEAGAAVDPDERGVVFFGELRSPGGVWGIVFETGCRIACSIDHPHDFDVGPVDFVDFIDAQGGGADEIGPPVVVSVGFDAKVFPSAECGAAGDDDVLSPAADTQEEG